MQGDFLVQLDSDDELYPWTLARVVHYFAEVPAADAVTGLYVQSSDSRLLVRVKDGRKLITPNEYARQDPLPDCVGAVRRTVVNEWLQKRPDYFAFEAHQWVTFNLRHSQLYVDEPWALVNTDGDDRVSTGASNERLLNDYRMFLEEHEKELLSVACRPLDVLLFEAWLQLRRANCSAEAEIAQRHLRRRGVPYRKELLTRALRKAHRALPWKSARQPPVRWL